MDSAQKIVIEQLDTSESVRADLMLAPLVKRIRAVGFVPNLPIKAFREGMRIVVYDGVRRIEALRTVRNENPEYFNRIVPDGCVECIVYASKAAAYRALLV